MYNFNSLTKKQKYFSTIFLIGFIIKYNYLLLRIFYVPSITGLLLKNLVVILFIIYFLLPLVKRKKGRLFLLFLLVLFSIMFIANFWYNKYFGDYLSFSDMVMGQGIRPSEVLLRQIINFWELIFVLDLVLLGYFLSQDKTTNFKNKISNSFKERKKGSRIIVSAIIILLLFTQIFATNILLGNHTPEKLYSKSTSGFVNVYGLLPLYGYEFYLSSISNNLNRLEAKTPSFEEKCDNSSKKLIKKDVNIIAIQIESLDEKLIDYKYNNQEITPFLNQLKQESLYFENFYAQHVNGSFDAEISFLTSLYPVNKNYAFQVNDMSQFPSIVRLFNNEGYQTLAFHGNNKGFFNRHKAFPELGFDKFYSREDFSAAEKVIEMEESYLGINDYDFFHQSLDYLEDAKEPFFAHMITLTSHTPFDFYPPNEVKRKFMDIEDPLVRDYFRSIAFVDKSLEMFFKELEKRGLEEDTLVVIYSDHEAGIDKEEYCSSENFVMEKNMKAPEHIPLLIKHPALNPENIKQTGTTTDIAPTILSLLGMDNRGEEFIGSSLLDEEERPVLFMHELPKVLYKDHLFVKQLEEPEGRESFEKVDYIKNREGKQVTLSEEERQNIIEVIDYMKEFIADKRQED